MTALLLAFMMWQQANLFTAWDQFGCTDGQKTYVPGYGKPYTDAEWHEWCKTWECASGAPPMMCKPEPIDVPAIQGVVPNDKAALCFQRLDGCTVTDESGRDIDPDVWLRGTVVDRAHTYLKRWTCADKSRILLTAEDGSKHCIKFADPK